MLAEDELKRALKAWLEADGWSAEVAWRGAHGVDIAARRGKELWLIEVKGRGSRPEMRVNYFVAILGETLQRMSEPHAKYSIALPDLPQYRRLWDRLPQLAKDRTTISMLFVSEAHQAQHMAQRLRVRGVTMVEYSFTAASRHDLFAKLLDLIRRGRLLAEPHEDLRKELLRLEVKETAGGWRADHRRGGHDDHVVSVALAAQRIVVWMDNKEMAAKGSSSDRAEVLQAERITRQTAALKVNLLERYGDTPDTHEKIAAIEALYQAEPDMARRHLDAWLWADTYKERLARSTGGGRGFSAGMESDDEWEDRPE
jgi:hypothetical protein